MSRIGILLDVSGEQLLQVHGAHQVNDQWSVGGGMDVQYAIFKQELAVPTPGPGPDGAASIDGDSWNVGFSLSAMWQPTEETRFGARYRSEVNHNLTGDMKPQQVFEGNYEKK